MLPIYPVSSQVLIIQSQQAARDHLVGVLSPFISRVLEADTMARALALCQEFEFSTVLLAAEGEQAYDSVARLRQTVGDSTRIVLLVQSVDRAILDRLYEAGGNDYFLEPVQVQDIQNRLLPLLSNAFHYQAILEDLAHHAQDAIGLYFDGQLEFVNPAFERLFGFTKAEIRAPGFNYLERVVPAQRETVQEFLARFAAGEQSLSGFEVTGLHRDGQRIHLEMSLIYLLYKSGTAVWIMVRDITASHLAKQREEEMIRNYANEVRRYQSLFEQSNDAIFIIDVAGLHLACNQRAVDLFGYDRDELLSMTVYDMVAPAEHEASRLMSQKLLSGERVPPYERIFRRKDGKLLNVEVNVEVVTDESGAPLYVQSLLRDITQRKHNEANAVRQRRLAEALRDSATVLNRTLDLDVVLDQILTQAARVVPHTTSSVALIDGTEARIVRCRGYQERGQDEKAILSLQFPLNVPSNYRRIMETKRTLVIPDTRTWPDWIFKEEVAWIRSNLTAPIIAWDTVIGFLHVDSEIPNLFTQEDAEALMNFAAQVATAVNNARLHEQVETMNRATAFLFASLNQTDLTILGQQIVEAVVNEFGQVDCGILLVEEATGAILRLARSGDYQVDTRKPLSLSGQGLVPEAIRTGQAVYAPEVSRHPHYLLNDPRTNSELVIPLFNSRKEVVGALDLQSEERNAFVDSDLLILNAFAERAAMALENLQHTKTLEIHVAERTRQLRETNEQISAIFNYTSDAIILIGLDGRIKRNNQAFYHLFRIDEGKAEKLLLKDLVTPESAAYLDAALADVIRYQQPCQQELVAHVPGESPESPVHLEIELSPLLGDEEQVSGVVCVMHNITRRKEEERQWLEAIQREREFHELRAFFLARASHEFRTPLAVMMTAAEMLRQYYDRMSVKQRDLRLEQIENEIHKMVHLIDNATILNQTTPYQSYDDDDGSVIAAQVCQQAIYDIEAVISASHRITFSHPEYDILLKIDVNSFRHIVNKLLENAMKFSKPGTAVTITLAQAGNEATLVVQDQGIGIPESDQERLFQVFYRGSNAPTNMGAGLGLVIVKRIVDFYGGRISVASQVNVGTTFTVTLPCVFLSA